MDGWLTKDGVIAVLYVISSTAGLIWVLSQWAVARRAQPEEASDRLWALLRWSTLVAFVGTWAIVTVRCAHGVQLRVPSMTLFMTAVVIATLQWFNVWFIAWPAASLRSSSRGLERAQAVLRLNATTAFPMMFFFAAACWATELGGSGRWRPRDYWLITVALYSALGIAAIAAPQIVRVALRPVILWVIFGAAMPFTLRLI